MLCEISLDKAYRESLVHIVQFLRRDRFCRFRELQPRRHVRSALVRFQILVPYGLFHAVQHAVLEIAAVLHRCFGIVRAEPVNLYAAIECSLCRAFAHG